MKYGRTLIAVLIMAICIGTLLGIKALTECQIEKNEKRCIESAEEICAHICDAPKVFK